MFLSRVPIFKCVKRSAVDSMLKNIGSQKRSLSATLRDAISPEIEENFITVDKRKIKYVRTGCGPHAVLCCPGALGSAWTDFKHQILGLDHNKLTIVVWDPPGYGQSRPPEKDTKPGFYIRDAHLAYGLMKALDLPNFSVLGWSAGSLPAIGLATTYPNNIKKLVIWGCISTVSQREVQVLEKLRDTIDSWPDALKSQYIALYGDDQFRTMYRVWIDTVCSHNRNKDGDLILSYVKQVKCPALIVHGTKDHIVTMEEAENIRRYIPESELRCFENGRHNVHEQYYEEFNSVVMDFLLKPHPVKN